jgi:hypothetical protein
MFRFRSLFQVGRAPNDDEQITAYIDGQMDARPRAAFEARLRSDADLRRRLDATRLLVQTARAMPPLRAPRDFRLPASMAAGTAQAQMRRAPTSVTWQRLGAAVAAAVFVFAIGLDASGVMNPRAAQAPSATLAYDAAATSAPAEAPIASTVVSEAANSASVASAAVANTEASAATAAPAGTPQAKGQAFAVPTATEASGAGVMSASVMSGEVTPTAPGVESSQRLTMTADQSAEPTPEPRALAAQATGPTSTSMSAPTEATSQAALSAPQPQPQETAPLVTWPRVVAALALLIAIALGVSGWLRR